MNIEINPEFRALIPPLSPEEYGQLEKNILADGCREPLVLFNGVLVDGHNRLAICTKHDLPFNTVAMDFTDSLAVKLWMIENQAGRRNLTDGWKYLLAQSKKDMLLEQGKKTQGARTDILSTIDKKLEPHNTREIIAEELGWSPSKVGMADKVWKSSRPEIKEQVLAGEVSINEAYKALKTGATHVSEGNNDWYTPIEHIEAVRRVLGVIDTDPASSHVAQEVVKATHYFTTDNCGLSNDWTGHVFLNPPYSMPEIKQFTDKLINEVEAGRVTEAIVLTNNSSDTSWFHDLFSTSSMACLTRGRLPFYSLDNETMSTRQGQCFFYMGDNREAFKNEFTKFGLVVVKA